MSLIYSNLKIVKFLGGLGNQMFQYAFYKALKNHFENVKADTSDFETYSLHNGLELENIFNIQLSRATTFESAVLNRCRTNKWHIRKLRRISGLKHAYYEEKSEFNFDSAIYAEKDNCPRYFWGYWQNEEYFRSIRNLLLNDFKFIIPLNDTNQSIANKIHLTNSVSLHVRRGDYINHSTLGNIATSDYYRKAIRVIKEKLTNPTFFVFSDDIEWCKSNISEPSIYFIDNNSTVNNYIDMQLMSMCKHNIIANSSFSWWAAWLNQNPDKIIIAPKKWINNSEHFYHNPTPLSWIRI